MKRRSFLKSLLALPFLPMLGWPKPRKSLVKTHDPDEVYPYLIMGKGTYNEQPPFVRVNERWASQMLTKQIRQTHDILEYRPDKIVKLRVY